MTVREIHEAVKAGELDTIRARMQLLALGVSDDGVDEMLAIAAGGDVIDLEEEP